MITEFTLEEIVALNHITMENAKFLGLLEKCKACNKEIIFHTPNDEHFCLIAIAKGETRLD